jgi:hypothetical protein
VNKPIMMWIFPAMAWFLGAKTKEQKRLLKGVIQRTDIAFVKWCIWAIARWQHHTHEPNVIHVHGTSDKLLPYRYVKPDHVIKNGEHLMIRNRPAEMSQLLKQLCS